MYSVSADRLTDLQQRCCQVHSHEDGRQSCVATFHQVNGVQEDQVAWDHQ